MKKADRHTPYKKYFAIKTFNNKNFDVKTFATNSAIKMLA